jgi:hypothetical protein
MMCRSLRRRRPEPVRCVRVTDNEKEQHADSSNQSTPVGIDRPQRLPPRQEDATRLSVACWSAGMTVVKHCLDRDIAVRALADGRNATYDTVTLRKVFLGQRRPPGGHCAIVLAAVKEAARHLRW